MKLKTFVTLLAAAQLSLWGNAALANNLTYTAPTGEQPGKFTGELPLAHIGSLALPDGLVKLKDDEMTIEAVPDWLFDREPVLRGAIVRAEVAAQKNTSVVAGLVFFIDGSWLPNLASRHSTDEIITSAGEQIKGKITGRVGQAFTVQPDQGATRKINFSDVKSITSARAFSFNIPTPTARIAPTDNSLSFESNLIKLAPSRSSPRFASAGARVPDSTLPGTDPGVSKQSLGTFIALDAISELAPAVSIPLVLNHLTQKHALKQINDALHQQLGVN